MVTSAKPRTLRDLVNTAARRGLPPTDPPRPLADVAKLCGITRGHLYHLLAGRKVAGGHTVARLAAGLGASRPIVERALAAAREAFRAGVKP